MELKLHGIGIISDNDSNYFNLLQSVVASVDENCYLSISRTPHSYAFRVSPSEPKYINILIEQLNTMHSKMGIHLSYSKSIKSSNNISFSLEISEESSKFAQNNKYGTSKENSSKEYASGS